MDAKLLIPLYLLRYLGYDMMKKASWIKKQEKIRFPKLREDRIQRNLRSFSEHSLLVPQDNLET